MSNFVFVMDLLKISPKYFHIRKDRPCYIISRIPHFGVIPPEALAQNFSLSEDELSFLRQEFYTKNREINKN